MKVVSRGEPGLREERRNRVLISALLKLEIPLDFFRYVIQKRYIFIA